MSTFSDKINKLRKRAVEIGNQLSALAVKRREYSLLASEGDSKALKVIADTDFESESLKKMSATVGSAIETAEALERQQELEVKQEQERKKQVDAYNLARAVIAENEAIDLALLQLREMCERRAHLLSLLGSTGLVDYILISRLSGKAPTTRAACASGLHKFCDLMTPPVALRFRSPQLTPRC